MLIVIIANAVSGGNNNSPASSSTSQPAAATNPAPSSSLASPSPAAPQYTVAQQQAIDAAQSYLSEGQGFSYAGLIQQLDSPDGNGFTTADATVAVNSLTVNWNQQAVEAAKGYMQTEPGWSACSLVQQLDSPDGSQFTQAQAEYAVGQVGLGSC